MRSIPLLRRLPDGAKVRLREYIPDRALRKLRPNHTKLLRSDAHQPQRMPAPLWAVICTWMEADVIGATVAHLRTRGAERVLLIDNDSPDDTVGVARAAGAEPVMTFATPGFDERLRFSLINEVIRSASVTSGLSRIWWAVCDADEFLEGPHESPLGDVVATVDERCRVVGARVFDHYPTPGLSYRRGLYPLASQPLCREKPDHRCVSGHHKHPVFRWDRSRPPVLVEHGTHQVACNGEILYEPAISLVMHHFPFRDEADTRRRLEQVVARGLVDEGIAAGSHDHLKARLRSLDAVYAGRFDEVVDYRTGAPGLSLQQWSSR